MTGAGRTTRWAASLSAIVLAAMTGLSYADAVSDANAGMDALNAGYYAKAVQLFTHAIKSGKLSSSDKESAYVERGKAYLGEKNDKAALADFRAALKLNPGDQEASDLQDQARGGGVAAAVVSPAQQQFDSAKALWQAGNCSDAEAQFQQGLALDPYNAAANFYYGDCLAKDGNRGGALGPLRLAVQYGDGLPEGAMATDEVKRLAQFTSPMQGNDDGCAIPIAPPVPEGATATAGEMHAARNRFTMYLRYSDRFASCVQDLIAGYQNQAVQNGYPGIDPRLQHKFQGPVDANLQQRQSLTAQFAAAESAYTAAHAK